MDLTSIMKALHSSVNEQTFKPLVKQELSESEWETLEWLCNKYNFFDINKFYVFPEATIKDKFIYCDYDNGFYFGLDNLDKSYLEFMNFSFDSLPRVMEHMKKVLEAENYVGLYIYMPDCVRFWDFKRRYKSMTKETAREVFKQIYGHIDFVRSICSNMSNEMIDYIKEDNQCQEYITIYRGSGEESTDVEQALSWTTDINTALFFACKQKDSTVYKARVKKCNIIMRLDDRDEKEVLVKFENLENIEEMDFISPDMINVLEYKYVFEGLNTLFKKAQEAVGLPCLYSTESIKGYHGLEHAERVTWLCCTIVNDIVAKTNSNPGFEPKDTIKLMLAALFHDCGRTNDNNEKHGVLGSLKVTRNKERLCKTFNLSNEDFKEIIFLIDYHDTEVEFDSKIGKLLKILKDADALDRYRLGAYRTEFDYNMLRTEEAKRLVLLNAFMYKNKVVEQIKEYF